MVTTACATQLFPAGKTDETRAISMDLALSIRPSKPCTKYTSWVGSGGIHNAGRLGIWCLGPERTQPSAKWSSPAPEQHRPTEELVSKEKGTLVREKQSCHEQETRGHRRGGRALLSWVCAGPDVKFIPLNQDILKLHHDRPDVPLPWTDCYRQSSLA